MGIDPRQQRQRDGRELTRENSGRRKSFPGNLKLPFLGNTIRSSKSLSGSSFRNPTTNSVHTAKELHAEVENLKERRKQNGSAKNLKERRKKTGDGNWTGASDDILTVHEIVQMEQRELYRLQSYIVLIVIITLILGISVNEICGAQDYQPFEPSPEEVLQIKEQHGRPCESRLAESLKIVLSCLSTILVFLVVKQWWLRVQLQERNTQIEEYYFIPGGTQLKRRIPLSMYPSLIFEVAICAIHPFPYIYSDIEVLILESPLFYRFESVMVGCMFLRLYLIWRWLQLVAFYRFLNLEDSFAMEDYSAMDQMHLSSNISANTFPLKVLMSKYPVVVIASTMSVIFLSMCYLVRIAEGPAYQPHSDSWWNQMWITITQGTTGYGGTTPVTHWGRFFTVLMMLCGPMTVSFMTATTSKSITLTADELALHQHMEANTHKIRVLTAAAEILQNWWREKLLTIPRLQGRTEKKGGATSKVHGSDHTSCESPSETKCDADGRPSESISIRGKGPEGGAVHTFAHPCWSSHRHAMLVLLLLGPLTESIQRSLASSSLHRKLGSSSSHRRNSTLVDIPLAATNPIALKFVYMLGKPYQDAKTMLLIRNFYIALAAYDRFLVQHRKMTDFGDGEPPPFHRLGSGNSVCSDAKAGNSPGGFEELRRDVETLQTQMADVRNHVLEGMESSRRMERMLALLLPPDIAARMQAEKTNSERRGSAGQTPEDPSHAMQAGDHGAGVGEVLARQPLEDGQLGGGKGESVRELMKTVSFREPGIRTADHRQLPLESEKRRRGHSMEGLEFLSISTIGLAPSPRLDEIAGPGQLQVDGRMRESATPIVVKGQLGFGQVGLDDLARDGVLRLFEPLDGEVRAGGLNSQPQAGLGRESSVTRPILRDLSKSADVGIA